MANILAYVELVEDRASWASLIALRQGRLLATQLGATLYAVLPCATPPLYGDNDIIAILSRQGVDKVILMTHTALREPALFTGHGDALLAAAAQFPPSLLIVPEGAAAKDIAPRVAARLGALFVRDPKLTVNKNHQLVIEQPTFGHSQISRYTTADLEHAVVAVVTPNPQLHSASGSEEAEVLVISPGFRDGRPSAPETAKGIFSTPLREMIVLAGRGVMPGEPLEALRQLTVRLGATLVQTQGAFDTGLDPNLPRLEALPPGSLPDVVLAVGVHGTAAALTRLSHASLIVSINPDRESPIARAAHVALAAPVLDALRQLLEAIGPAPASAMIPPREATGVPASMHVLGGADTIPSTPQPRRESSPTVKLGLMETEPVELSDGEPEEKSTANTQASDATEASTATPSEETPAETPTDAPNAPKEPS